MHLIKLLLFLNIFSSLWVEFHKIASTNDLKNKADEAFHRNDFQKATLFYDSLLTHYKVQDEKLRLNFAHALFKNGDRKKASEQYDLLTVSENNKISSNAFQQLGLIFVYKGKNEKALGLFKKALKVDPLNEKARFNYELLQKLQQQELESEQASKTSKSNTSSKERGKGEKEENIKRVNGMGGESGEKGEKEEGGNVKEESESGVQRKGESGRNKGDSRELQADNKGNRKDESFRIRLSEIQLSEEKARFLLDEMRNEEVQYIQQLRKKQFNKQYKGPDW